MALPTTGALNLSQVGTEIHKPLLSAVDMNDIEVRKLCNKKTLGTEISMNDLRGTAYGVGPGYAPANFVDATGQVPYTTVTSNTIVIEDAGIDPVSFAIFSSLDAYYQINGGAWVSKATLGTIKNGDTLALQINNASNGSVTATYNGVNRSWNVGVSASTIIDIWTGLAYGNGLENSGTTAYVINDPISNTVVDTIYEVGITKPTLPTLTVTYSNGLFRDDRIKTWPRALHYQCRATDQTNISSVIHQQSVMVEYPGRLGILRFLNINLNTTTSLQSTFREPVSILMSNTWRTIRGCKIDVTQVSSTRFDFYYWFFE